MSCVSGGVWITKIVSTVFLEFRGRGWGCPGWGTSFCGSQLRFFRLLKLLQVWQDREQELQTGNQDGGLLFIQPVVRRDIFAAADLRRISVKIGRVCKIDVTQCR